MNILELKARRKELTNLLNSGSIKSMDSIINTINVIDSILSKEYSNKTIHELLLSDYYYLSPTSFMWDLVHKMSSCDASFIISSTPQSINSKDTLKLLFSFFSSCTNDYFYNVFKRIYSLNKKNITLISNKNATYKGQTIYLEYFNKTYIEVIRRKNLMDVTTLVHEFGHAISFNENYHINIFNEHYPFIEVISIFFELIASDYLDLLLGSNITSDIFKKYVNMSSTLNEELEIIKKIKNEEELDTIINELKNSKQKRILKTKPAGDYIYVCGFAIATNLFIIYKKDPEYAFYLLKQIINIDLKLSPQKYAELISNLGIVNTFGVMEELKRIKNRCH